VFIPVLLTFVAVFLVVSAIFLAVTTVKESPTFALRMRLRRLAINKANGNMPDEVRSEILKEIPRVERILTSYRLFRSIDRSLDRAGLKIQLHNFLMYSCTAAIVPAIGVYLFWHKALPAILMALFVIFLIILTVRFLILRRVDKLTEQLPDVLMMISRSLRAGHSMTSAVELVGLETPDPSGELFRTAYEQQKLGMSIIDTLTNMLDRIESLDLRFFVTTVSINSETGGNLSETLDKLAKTILERLNIRRQVRVYTAQGRLSGYVLAALPICVFFVFNVLNPAYEQLLIKEKIGNYFLMFAAIMQILGYFFIRKIINIRI